MTQRYNDNDTRYAAGVAGVYANAMADKFGGDAEKYYEAALKFINENVEWHESNRWKETQLKDGYEDAINNLLKAGFIMTEKWWDNNTLTAYTAHCYEKENGVIAVLHEGQENEVIGFGFSVDSAVANLKVELSKDA